MDMYNSKLKDCGRAKSPRAFIDRYLGLGGRNYLVWPMGDWEQVHTGFRALFREWGCSVVTGQYPYPYLYVLHLIFLPVFYFLAAFSCPPLAQLSACSIP